MTKKYEWQDPFKRPLRVTTCCPTGQGTCILEKIVVTKAFNELGVPADIEPTSESSPGGPFSIYPDLIVCQGLRAKEIKEKMPKSLLVIMNDMGKSQQLVEDLAKAMITAGWLKEV